MSSQSGQFQRAARPRLLHSAHCDSDADTAFASELDEVRASADARSVPATAPATVETQHRHRALLLIVDIGSERTLAPVRQDSCHCQSRRGLGGDVRPLRLVLGLAAG